MEKSYKIGNCVIGQSQINVSGEKKYRYILCETKKFNYENFIGVTAYNHEHGNGKFYSTHKYNVTEETTNIDINGLYATCFPEYEEKTGTILTNIFDETEIGILNAYGKNISSCIEKDYSIYRPFIYRLLMQPMEYTIYSNIKFNRTIALSNILTISNRTDILVKGTFTAEEAIDILLSVSKKPEKYGFYEETKNTIKIKK